MSISKTIFLSLALLIAQSYLYAADDSPTMRQSTPLADDQRKEEPCQATYFHYPEENPYIVISDIKSSPEDTDHPKKMVSHTMRHFKNSLLIGISESDDNQKPRWDVQKFFDLLSKKIDKTHDVQKLLNHTLRKQLRTNLDQMTSNEEQTNTIKAALSSSISSDIIVNRVKHSDYEMSCSIWNPETDTFHWLHKPSNGISLYHKGMNLTEEQKKRTLSTNCAAVSLVATMQCLSAICIQEKQINPEYSNAILILVDNDRLDKDLRSADCCIL